MLRLLPEEGPRHTDAPVACLAANTTWYVVNFRARLIEALQADGWRVVVFSPPDAHVARLEAMGAVHRPMRLDNASTNPAHELATLVRLGRELAAIAPDVVLTWTPKVNIYTSLAARALRIPVIANISGLGRAFGGPPWLRRLSGELYRVALRWPVRVFFQNDDDRASFVGRRLVDPSRAVRLPGSGVDVDRFRPVPRPDPSAPFRFLLISRLLWDKGVGEFAEAARLVRARRPHVQFALAGFVDPSHPNAVPAATIEGWRQEGTLDYLGAFDDVVPAYACADCVVLPSYYREGVPRTLLEAASMGRPIITADSVGCRDAVEHGVTGWLVTPRDARALADRMLAVLDMPADARARIGAAAAERARRCFDERIVIEAYRTALAQGVPVDRRVPTATVA